MKVVLDTNVFISGIFFGGAPSQVLRAWRDGELEVVVSRPIVEEYRTVFASPVGAGRHSGRPSVNSEWQSPGGAARRRRAEPGL